jgi:hypothetical protein
MPSACLASKGREEATRRLSSGYVGEAKLDDGSLKLIHPVDHSFIHGGAFTGGGAENITYNQARVLLEQGFVCLSLEYRLLPQ